MQDVYETLGHFRNERECCVSISASESEGYENCPECARIGRRRPKRRFQHTPRTSLTGGTGCQLSCTRREGQFQQRPLPASLFLEISVYGPSLLQAVLPAISPSPARHRKKQRIEKKSKRSCSVLSHNHPFPPSTCCPMASSCQMNYDSWSFTVPPNPNPSW